MTTMRVVGECFFWYRLTRVFPDKFHRAVKWLCVCVCDIIAHITDAFVLLLNVCIEVLQCISISCWQIYVCDIFNNVVVESSLI